MKPVVRLLVLAAIVCAAPGMTAFVSQPQAGLDLVLEHARAYVIGYEAELGTLIGKEEYVQEALWRIPGPIGRGGRIERARRRLSSDFLLLPVDSTWFGVRNVVRMDGVPVEPVDDFAAQVVSLPGEIIPNWPDNVRYNIGEFDRTFNVPTFALKVLRPQNADRFEFAAGGDGRIEGERVQEVRFTEVASPTLVQGRDGEDRFASGTLWVRPDNGEILRTEIEFEMERDAVSYTARVRVSYASSPDLGMLIPRTMEEYYESQYHSVETRADYSDFMRFGVEVIQDPIDQP